MFSVMQRLCLLLSPVCRSARHGATAQEGLLCDGGHRHYCVETPLASDMSTVSTRSLEEPCTRTGHRQSGDNRDNMPTTSGLFQPIPPMSSSGSVASRLTHCVKAQWATSPTSIHLICNTGVSCRSSWARIYGIKPGQSWSATLLLS